MRQSPWFRITIVLAWLFAAGLSFAEAPAEVGDLAATTADHAVDGAAEESHKQPELINPKWQEALYTIIVFGIFFVVLSIFVWPKILASLQAREGKVLGDLKQAEDAAKEATKTLEQYKQQLADAQKQAQQIVDESRGAAQQVAAQVKEQAQTEMTQMRQRAEGDINAAKERALSEIYEQTATLATQVAGQILRREINVGDQESLVRESIAKLNDAGQN
jgi:F-type H+-transporting ATPase subunit b